MINCIIIEDEPLALERTKSYVSNVPYLNLLNSFNNGIDAIAFINNNKIDLIFLDIEMDGLSGIELLDALIKPPKVIITTAYEKYAIKGYELNISDYLLKPFSFPRFLQAVKKVGYETRQNILDKKNHLFVKTEYRLEKIAFSDILFIEGMRDYRNIQTMDKKILTLETFTELEKILPKDRFCRVHKSFMVSIDKIEFVERSRIKINDKRIPISETYKNEFFDLIGFPNKKL
ncbi:LytTR family DNA-binding domain-containing protein [Arenibacter sp. M-2]|uniref:LytR/AlgR family response regulator transcription factor n=1 Tax=Arenibacter sp. M-2 TaxID=3053612 RepID=UPI0025708E3B|nr:LytTR family DNA-binding domain-containing protein [Arenibacter sp. M-2]MDL5512937.1 LytTR family DNA-binding domain-containing protein [Arenibacter sp. M-2]